MKTGVELVAVHTLMTPFATPDAPGLELSTFNCVTVFHLRPTVQHTTISEYTCESIDRVEGHRDNLLSRSGLEAEAAAVDADAVHVVALHLVVAEARIA